MVYRYNKPPTQRQLQVAESIKHTISEMFLRNDLSHPFFEQNIITVSEVRISPDLKLATVFISAADEIDMTKLLKLLNEISHIFRSTLRKKMALRTIPQVRFAYDESFKNAQKIEDIINSLH